jgi:uncharacterized membrane protein
MKKTHIAGLILLLSVYASAYFAYPLLPPSMPMHWNIQGKVDDWWPKEQAIWFMPALVSAMYVLFRILPSFDPNKKKYHLFRNEWEIMQLGLLSFFTYLHLIILYATLNPKTNIMPFMFIGFGSLFILLGNYLSKIRQNYFIGIKTPWTLADENNWNKTHRYASWCFVLVGIVTLVEAVFIWNAAPVIFGGIMFASFLPMLYSFLLFKGKAHYMKYVHIGIAVIVVVLFGIRFLSGEDDWICRKGKWIPHGKPTSAAPNKPCR